MVGRGLRAGVGTRARRRGTAEPLEGQAGGSCPPVHTPLFCVNEGTICLLLLSFWWYRFECRDLGQAGTLHLNHISSHFCFSYFLEQRLVFCLGLGWATVLLFHLPNNWDDRLVPPYPAYWLRWGGLCYYLPRLVLNLDPPDLCLLRSWDYRCEPSCPALGHPILRAMWESPL
jgi:hypothetical protein